MTFSVEYGKLLNKILSFLDIQSLVFSFLFLNTIISRQRTILNLFKQLWCINYPNNYNLGGEYPSIISISKMNAMLKALINKLSYRLGTWKHKDSNTRLKPVDLITELPDDVNFVECEFPVPIGKVRYIYVSPVIGWIEPMCLRSSVFVKNIWKYFDTSNVAE